MWNGLMAWLLIMIGECDSKKYLNLTKCINAPLHWAITGTINFSNGCQTLQLSAWTFCLCNGRIFSPTTRSIRTAIWRLRYFYFHFWLLTWRETWSISTFGCPRPSQLCSCAPQWSVHSCAYLALILDVVRDVFGIMSTQVQDSTSILEHINHTQTQNR